MNSERLRRVPASASTCIVMVVSLWTTPLSAQPLLQYLFNDTGSTASDSGSSGSNLPMTQWNGTTWNEGDNHGAEDSGVSGMPGDRAYSDPSVVFQEAGSNDHFFGGFAGGVNVPAVQSLSELDCARLVKGSHG